MKGGKLAFAANSTDGCFRRISVAGPQSVRTANPDALDLSLGSEGKVACPRPPQPVGPHAVKLLRVSMLRVR